MSTATSGDFLGGGGEVVDPFKGRAPLTLAEQAAAEDARRQRLLQEQARQTAATNNRPGGYNTSRGQDSQDSVDASNKRVQDSRIALGFDPHKGNQRGFLENLAHDPVTMGVLAAPWLLTGGAALAGELGVAAGTGSIAAGEGTVAGAPALTTGGAVIEATAPAAIPTAAAAGTTAVPAVASGFTAGEAIRDGVQVLGAVAPLAIDELTSGDTPEEQRLIAKQQQLAQEAKARIGQNQEAAMNALGQQLLAFNPRNQMMAKIYGPDAAFAPTDFAKMVQNPIPPPQMPPELQALAGKTTKNTPEQDAAFRAYAEQLRQYDEGNRRRSEQMMSGIAPVGPGPSPLDPRTPQAARKY